MTAANSCLQSGHAKRCFVNLAESVWRREHRVHVAAFIQQANQHFHRINGNVTEDYLQVSWVLLVRD